MASPVIQPDPITPAKVIFAWSARRMPRDEDMVWLCCVSANTPGLRLRNRQKRYVQGHHHGRFIEDPSALFHPPRHWQDRHPDAILLKPACRLLKNFRIAQKHSEYGITRWFRRKKIRSTCPSCAWDRKLPGTIMNNGVAKVIPAGWRETSPSPHGLFLWQMFMTH